VSSKPGRESLTPTFRDLFRHWWPVGVWLVVIRLESTDYASANNTFGILYRLSRAVFGEASLHVILLLNSILRKSGHFIGYAALSLLVFLALKYSHRDRLKPVLQRRWGTFFRDFWQFDWALTAVLFTVLTASLDEIHQSFLPSRTGQWQDVALDTAGALLMQLLLYARAVHSMSLQRKHAVEEREPTLTP
jgi:VanZ family protein